MSSASVTPLPYKPKLAKSAKEAIVAADRRLMVVGPSGSGKTTFSVSASKFAGDHIPRKDRVLCSDVVVFQGDNEGIVGAYSAGFEPGYIYDLSGSKTWDDYVKDLKAAVQDIRPLVSSGDVKFAVIDLGLPNRLIQSKVTPSVQKDWIQVSNLGCELFTTMCSLGQLTIIANAQIKAMSGAGETIQAQESKDARAIAGLRTTYMTDLTKGVNDLWKNNGSLQVSREVKRSKEKGLEYFSHTQSNAKFEAKSRFAGILKPTEPGDLTLRNFLNRAYSGLL